MLSLQVVRKAFQGRRALSSDLNEKKEAVMSMTGRGIPDRSERGAAWHAGGVGRRAVWLGCGQEGRRGQKKIRKADSWVDLVWPCRPQRSLDFTSDGEGAGRENKGHL